MTPRRCSRLWTVEGVRDGRVAGAERLAFERHLATCEDCSSEQRELDALAHALQDLPAALPDPVSIRRRRQNLLAELDAGVRTGAGSWFTGRRRAFAGFVAVLFTAAGIWVALSRTRSVRPPDAAAASMAEVEARAGARWSSRREGSVEWIVIEDGTLHIRVQRRHPDERVRFMLPDGEIEDRGTAFTVSVSRSRTDRVSVEDGSVVLRLNGRPELVLDAAEHWSRESSEARMKAPAVDLAPMAASRVDTVGAEPPPITRGPASTETRQLRASAHPVSTPASSVTPSALIAPPNSAAPIRSVEPATRAGGSMTDAARAEDAAYLEILGHLRAGRRDAARAAAQAYLIRFPGGFRTPEVRSIAE